MTTEATETEFDPRDFFSPGFDFATRTPISLWSGTADISNGVLADHYLLVLETLDGGVVVALWDDGRGTERKVNFSQSNLDRIVMRLGLGQIDFEPDPSWPVERYIEFALKQGRVGGHGIPDHLWKFDSHARIIALIA